MSRCESTSCDKYVKISQKEKKTEVISKESVEYFESLGKIVLAVSHYC